MAIKQAAGGIALAMGGGLAVYAAMQPEAARYRRQLMLVGVGAIGIGGILAVSALPDAIDEFKREAVNTRNAQGAIGILGKLIFGQAPAGEIVKQVTTTADVSELGRPKNTRGIVGKILSPRPGDYIERSAFSGTYEVTVAVACVGENDIVDVVRVTVDEDPAFQAAGHSSADTSLITIGAGDAEQVITLRVPVALSVTVPFETIPVSLRLYVSGFLLDKVDVERE